VDFDTSNIRLDSIVSCIPENISYFDDEIKNYSQNSKSSMKLKKTMGYSEHRVCINQTTVSDMSADALNTLFKINKLKKTEIDLLILVTQTPDNFIPATSSQIHGSLNLNKKCLCIDVNEGCSGFIKALSIAATFAKTKQAKKIVIIAGDILSRRTSKHDRNSYPLIGDAVSACLFSRIKSEENSLFGNIMHDGSGSDAIMIPAGGLREMYDNSTSVMKTDQEGNARSSEHLVMKGRDVFTFTQFVVVPYLQEFLKKTIKYKTKRLFIHQANDFIISKIRNKLNLNQKELPSNVILKYGNSSSSTIPLAIVDSSLNDGPIGKYIAVSGFGVGLSWGCAILRTNIKAKFKILEGNY
jgi:3-oxoacyl-[acyl-carrier-protein] synthase-3